MAEEMKVYDWDDEITNDGNEEFETVTLPEGVYPFEVIKVEKAWHEKSDKLPECNMAKVFLRIDGGEMGTGLCVENLYLCEKTEWRAASFLRSIGLKKHGEPTVWRNLTHCDGEKGRCKVVVNKYKDKDNNERSNNKVDKFYDKEEAAPKKAFTKGAF